MSKKYLQAQESGLCCELCYEALESGILSGDVLSLLPHDRVVVAEGLRGNRGVEKCALCGYVGELDVVSRFTSYAIEEFEVA